MCSVVPAGILDRVLPSVEALSSSFPRFFMPDCIVIHDPLTDHRCDRCATFRSPASFPEGDRAPPQGYGQCGHMPGHRFIAGMSGCYFDPTRFVPNPNTAKGIEE